MFYVILLLFSLQYLNLVERCYGHGYLADPPARSSAWLFDSDFASCCSYYNHMEMFCGGADYQWVANGGNCSICGEAYNAKPRLLGVGDAMYLGKIVRTYTQGSVIPVTVVLTANHRGIFEFRICSIDNNPAEDATQNCLNLNLLKSVNGSTRYGIEPTLMTIHINVTLPANLTCKHCVFQWKYITGNSWGMSKKGSCVGCGAKNEEFYGCSDIAIHSDVESVVNPLQQTTTETGRQCSSSMTFSRLFDLTALVTQYCHTICSTGCASDRETSNYKGCIESCEKLCVCK